MEQARASTRWSGGSGLHDGDAGTTMKISPWATLAMTGVVGTTIGLTMHGASDDAGDVGKFNVGAVAGSMAAIGALAVVGGILTNAPLHVPALGVGLLGAATVTGIISSG